MVTADEIFYPVNELLHKDMIQVSQVREVKKLKGVTAPFNFKHLRKFCIYRSSLLLLNRFEELLCSLQILWRVDADGLDFGGSHLDLITVLQPAQLLQALCQLQ